MKQDCNHAWFGLPHTDTNTILNSILVGVQGTFGVITQLSKLDGLRYMINSVMPFPDLLVYQYIDI